MHYELILWTVILFSSEILIRVYKEQRSLVLKMCKNIFWVDFKKWQPYISAFIQHTRTLFTYMCSYTHDLQCCRSQLSLYHLGVALRCDLCFPIDSKRFFSINTNLIKFILICTLCIYYCASVYNTFIVNDCSIGEMWMTILQHLLSAHFLMMSCPETLVIAENYVFQTCSHFFPDVLFFFVLILNVHIILHFIKKIVK